MEEQLTDPRAPTARRRRVFGHPVVIIIVGFVLFVILLQLLLALVPALVVAMSGHELPANAGNVPPTAPGVGSAFAVGRLLAGILSAALGLWLYRRVIAGWCEGRSDVAELRLDQTARRWLGAGPLLSLAVLGLTLLAVAIFADVQIAASALPLSGLLAALGLSLFAAVAEELFARGTLFRISELHLGSVAGLLITGLVFGLQHATNPAATLASTLAVAIEGGVMLSSIFLLTRTLWAPIGVHFGWNFGQSVLALPVSGHASLGAVRVELGGPQWLTGGDFGLEVSAIAIALWMGVAVGALLLAARTGKLRSWRAARTSAQIARAAR